MKKVLATIMFLFLGAHSCMVLGDPIDVNLQIIDQSPGSNGNIKTPPQSLVITQDGNILTLPATSEDYTLELRNANGTLVYSVYVPSGTTQIILPTTLSGSFEIRLVADTYYYVGYIVL